MLLINRSLQWSSAIIVTGLTSYFIHRGFRGEHSKYTEVIVRTRESSLTLRINFQTLIVSGLGYYVYYILLAGFCFYVGPPGALSLLVMGIDMMFSYL